MWHTDALWQPDWLLVHEPSAETRRRAVRVLAEHATCIEDLAALLAMVGLEAREGRAHQPEPDVPAVRPGLPPEILTELAELRASTRQGNRQTEDSPADHR